MKYLLILRVFFSSIYLISIIKTSFIFPLIFLDHDPPWSVHLSRFISKLWSRLDRWVYPCWYGDIFLRMYPPRPSSDLLQQLLQSIVVSDGSWSDLQDHSRLDSNWVLHCHDNHHCYFSVDVQLEHWTDLDSLFELSQLRKLHHKNSCRVLRWRIQ